MKEKYYGLTDEQVEAEIARLNASEAVALARHEQRLKYRRKQVLYTLRSMEKRGRALAEMGITSRILDELERDTEIIERIADGGEKDAEN